MDLITKYFFLIALLLLTSVCHAQSTINLSGNVSLDFGVAAKDYQVDIIVSNHTVVFLPIVGIVRPLLSRVTQSVTIQQGQSSVDYLVNGISTDAVDYVIEFRCDDCNGVFTSQYYTTNGNSFSIGNSVYIDPDDLPSNLNFTLSSSIAISGLVSLANSKLAEQDLNFLLSVSRSTAPNSILRRISVVVPKDSNSAIYSINDLIRETGLVGFNLQLDCLNCLATSVLTIDYADTLDASIDNIDINFEVEFDDVIFFPAIHYLLFDNQQ